MQDFAFYNALPELTGLRDIQNDKGFRECPLDWVVVISDIRGSTKAVADGKYREVNVCGAALIALVQEKLATRAFPFVFGGDGATLLLPASLFENLKEDFRRLILKISRDFGLDLRVGAVPYAKLAADGAKIFVGRLKISNTNHLATLKGDGVALAEKWIKSGDRYLLQPASGDETVGLSKLSCRFRPIPARQSSILTLLVVPRDSAGFLEFLREFDPYLTDPRYRPVAGDLRMDGFLNVFLKERKIEGGTAAWKVFYKILFLKTAALLGTLFKNSHVGRVVTEYYGNIPLNSDYQKFDGALRTVIDCSDEERLKILGRLEEYEKRGVLTFGHSVAKNAVMTCVVDDIGGGQHIHFIDGGGGGYTLAAKTMKAKPV